jgi:gliding-associated putative ABC transporter substrate-binding component GldG
MKTKLTVTGISSVVVVAVILIVLNLISVNVFGRVDLSEGKIYSLSQSSKDIVRNLDDRVTIKCYFSDDIPQPYNANARYLKDQLAEYKAYAGGNLNYVFIDPSKEGKEDEARSYRIPPVPINTFSKDKLEMKQVYMGLAILYEDRNEVIPVVQDVNSLEYEITRAIKRLASGTTPKVGFVTGDGELSLDKDLTYINKTVGQEYELVPVNLRMSASVPKDIVTLYVMGPKQKLSDWELYLLDQFLMRGGKLGILLDKVQANIQQGQAQPIDAGLGQFLAHFGLGVNSDLVIDVQNAQIAVQQQRGMFRMQSLKEYPFFPRAAIFSKDNLMVKDLESANFIFASSIDTSHFADNPQLKYSILARSSEHSGVMKPPYNIDPFREWSQLDFNRQYVPLGVAVTGEFTSYFAGKPKPAMDSTVTMDANTTIDDSQLESGSNGRLVVWGDANFMSDQAMRDKSNLILFQNMTDWLSEDEGLISIRSKEVTARPLKKVDDSTRSFVKFLNMFLMPLLVVAFGVARWQIRRQKRRRQLV